MTWSPLSSPLRMTQSPPSQEPVCTGLGAALPSGPMTQTKRPCSPLITAACGTSTPSCSPLVICTRTNWPGSQRPSGLGSSARICTVPSRGSTIEPL